MTRAGAPWALALWLNGVMVVATVALMAVPILAPAVFGGLGLSAEWVGVYSGALWAAALAASLGAGAALRRWGAWRSLQACLLLCALGLACGAGGGVVGLALAALLIGLGNGLETPVASQMLARGVPVPQRPWLFSLKQTGVQIGGLGGALLLPLLAGAAGWPWALAALALLAAVAALIVERPRRTHAAVDHPPGSERLPLADTLRELAQHRVLRRLALAAAAFGATQVCLNSFMVSYAVAERGATLQQAGLLLGVAQGGGLLGRLLWGWLASRHGRSLALLRALGAAMAVAAALLGAFGAQLPLALLLPLMLAFGLTASGWNGVFLAEIAQQVPLERVGTATGAVLVVMTVGLIAGPLAFAAVGSALSLGAAYVALALVAAAGWWMLPAPQSRSEGERS